MKTLKEFVDIKHILVTLGFNYCSEWLISKKDNNILLFNPLQENMFIIPYSENTYSIIVRTLTDNKLADNKLIINELIRYRIKYSLLSNWNTIIHSFIKSKSSTKLHFSISK